MISVQGEVNCCGAVKGQSMAKEAVERAWDGVTYNTREADWGVG